MNDLTVFSNEKFGEVRTTKINGKIWFVGKDVAIALGYKDTKQAIAVNVDSEDKIRGSKSTTPSITDSLGREQYPIYINESGVYALIFGSKLESAKEFKHWVTSEILPSIRETGSYTIHQHVSKTDRELDLMEKQLRIAESNAYKNLGDSYDGKSETFKEICQTYAFNALAGSSVMELPEVKKSYSAKDVGDKLGISANKVGIIANHYNLKTENFGCWQKDKAKYDSSKEVDSWLYFENAIPLIEEHKNETFKRK